MKASISYSLVFEYDMKAFIPGGDATQLLLRDGGAEELHEDPTVRQCPKVWTRGQKWKKCCRRWCAG